MSTTYRGLGYDVTIIDTGSEYIGINPRGQQVYNNTDFMELLQDACDGLNNNGTIKVNITDTITATKGITIVGAVGDEIVIEGNGMYNTTLDCNDAVTPFSFNTGAHPVLRGLGIELSGAGAQTYGIYGDDSGGGGDPTDTSIKYGVLDNIMISGGVASSKGIYLENAEFFTFNDIRLFNAGTHHCHLTMEADAAYSYNDALWTGNNMFKPFTNDQVSFKLEGNSSTEACNLLRLYGRFWFSNNQLKTGTVAIQMDYTYRMGWHGIHMENYVVGYDLRNNVQNCVFYQDRSYSFPRTGGTLIRIGDGGGNYVFGNEWKDCYWDFAFHDGSYIWDDDLNFTNIIWTPHFNTRNTETYNNNAGGGGAAALVLQPRKQGDGSIDGLTSTTHQTVTILDTTTSTVTAHNLNITPNFFQVTPIEDLGTASFWWIDTVGAANYTLNVDADPGQDVDFEVYLSKKWWTDV